MPLKLSNRINRLTNPDGQSACLKFTTKRKRLIRARELDRDAVGQGGLAREEIVESDRQRRRVLGVRLALESVRPGGRVVLAGIPGAVVAVPIVAVITRALPELRRSEPEDLAPDDT